MKFNKLVAEVIAAEIDNIERYEAIVDKNIENSI